MHIAILGTRGIPNRYGGFEAFAEHLSRHLVERGHQVTVYCRRGFTRPGDEQLLDPRIRRVILPSIPAKHLDTPIHTFFSALHVIFTSADVVLMVNAGNSPVAWIPRFFRTPVALNVDGLDRTRRKWGWLARNYLHLCEALSVRTPNAVVTDSLAIQEYFRERYKKETTMIAYGAELPPSPAPNPESVLARFGLSSKKFLLYVSRLEPENNPELVLAAYKNVQTDWPLVIVGGNDYQPEYPEHLRRLADPRVIFTGAIYGAGYWELQRNAGAFIFACEVGGIHPALIETMVAGNASLCLDTDSNRETVGECGLLFTHDPADLAAKISQLLSYDGLRSRLAQAARQRAQERYSWQAVTAKYEALFQQLLR